MAVSVKNYTNRFIVIVILMVMAIWAILFYALLMDEVYDNIDDGLKNQKIQIIQEAYNNPSILENSKEFGINQFIIYPAQESAEDIDKNDFSKEFIYMPYDSEDEPYRVLRTGFYTKEGTPYHLEIRTSTVEEDDFLINLAISLAVLYAVIVLSIFIINHFVFTRAWKPFHQILDNLNKYRFGESKRLDNVHTEVKEFNLLHNHLDEMIERNESAFRQQKQFLENASHELQTPLAVSIQKLELLLEDTNLNEMQVVKIAEAKNSLHRMVNLNKSLLMLSRIGNRQFSDIEKVNFNSLTKRLIEDFNDIALFKNISIQFIEKGTFKHPFNPNLAQVLLTNLLNNAIKYNIADGQIQVEATDHSFSIANTSTSGALNPDYIFERFYKGTQDNQSNGLGLSIVQAILKNYPEFALQYQYQNNLHTFLLKKNLNLSIFPNSFPIQSSNL